jgi:formate dehydrogenase maturation protein FdhE
MDEERNKEEKTVTCCPFCGEPDRVYFVGEQHGMEVYHCESCDTYFYVVELKPPFSVTITE